MVTMDALKRSDLSAARLSGEPYQTVLYRFYHFSSLHDRERRKVGYRPNARSIGQPIRMAAIYAGLSFTLTPACAEDIIPPPQAIAAGFSHLIFDEDFSTFQARPDGLSYVGKSGVWTNGLGFFSPAPSQLITWNGPGLLTLSSQQGAGGIINTHLRNWPHGSSAGSTLFRYGYFEVSMRLVGDQAAPNNWVSIWLFSAAHQEIAQNPDEWSEIDMFESGFYPAYSATVHDWHYNGAVFESPGQSPSYSAWAHIPSNIDFTQWHKYGALWEPGKVSYFFDDVFVQASATQPINDSQPCSLLLSVHGNGASKAQFRSVHVFQ